MKKTLLEMVSASCCVATTGKVAHLTFLCCFFVALYGMGDDSMMDELTVKIKSVRPLSEGEFHTPERSRWELTLVIDKVKPGSGHHENENLIVLVHSVVLTFRTDAKTGDRFIIRIPKGVKTPYSGSIDVIKQLDR